jgi:hypothetical protein
LAGSIADWPAQGGSGRGENGEKGQVPTPVATGPDAARCRDKQLQNISLDQAIEKRRLEQALNAKKFAALSF